MFLKMFVLNHPWLKMILWRSYISNLKRNSKFLSLHKAVSLIISKFSDKEKSQSLKMKTENDFSDFCRISVGDIHKWRRLLGLFGVLKTTSPLPKTGSHPHVSFHLLLGAPPPSPSEETSFMDGPLRKAELPQVGILFGTQFPSLGIFISKKVGFWKN